MSQPAPSKAGGRRRHLPPLVLPLLLALLPLSCASGDGSSTALVSGATALLVPFHSVVSCLPFSLLIRPSSATAAAANTSSVAASDGGSAAGGGTAPATTPSPAYTLRLDASDANITGAFEYSVTPDGTLHLSLSTPIATNSCASAIVELPADALREVRATVAARFGSDSNGYLVTENQQEADATDSPAVHIEGPFNLPSLKAALYYEGQGDPRLVIRGATVDTLTLAGGRCLCGATLFASGSFRNVRVHTDDVHNCPGPDLGDANADPCREPTAKVALVTERVFLSGSASVVTTNASLAIEGAAGPVVIANAGICNLHLPSDDAWIPVQPCLITGQPPPTEAGDGASLVAQQAGAFNQTCRFNRDENTTAGNAECRANVNATQFDQLSSLDSAAAAVQPLPGPLAEEALQQLLDRAHQLAPLAAVGDAAAAANLTGEAGRRNDPDLLVLLSEIAFSEGGHAGALAACEEVNWGCSTRFGCRDSFQRALALLINHNDTAGIRNALETGAEWERSDPQNQGKLSDPSLWVVGTVWGECRGGQYCVADFGGVRTPNTTALMLAAGLTLAGGYFREASAAAAAAPYMCKQGPEEGCKQVRRALAEAVMLAPRLRYGSSQEVINSAMAVSDPGWRACLLVEAPPPMAEGWAVGCSM